MKSRHVHRVARSISPGLGHIHRFFGPREETEPIRPLIVHSGQRCMDQVLKVIPGVAAHLDDILVSAKSKQEHFRRLEQGFERLKACNLRLRK